MKAIANMNDVVERYADHRLARNVVKDIANDPGDALFSTLAIQEWNNACSQLHVWFDGNRMVGVQKEKADNAVQDTSAEVWMRHKDDAINFRLLLMNDPRCNYKPSL